MKRNVKILLILLTGMILFISMASTELAAPSKQVDRLRIVVSGKAIPHNSTLKLTQSKVVKPVIQYGILNKQGKKYIWKTLNRQKINITSSKPAIIRISKSKTLCAKSSGMAVITFRYGNLMQKLKVRVPHSHHWKPIQQTIGVPAVYKTVSHPAMTEEIWVVDETAHTETVNEVYIECSCGSTFQNIADWDAHAYSELPLNPFASHSWTAKIKKIDIFHKEKGHYETVIISPAWEEKILVTPASTKKVTAYYKCSCGNIMASQNK